MIHVHLACVPGRSTAQQKGLVVTGAGPRFFTKGRVKRDSAMLAALLVPSRPDAPIDGPVSVDLTFVFPHLRETAKRRRATRVPKATRPDLDNSAKEAIDVLVKLGFLRDDGQITRLVLEKWHGPDPEVGIHIRIQEVPVSV